jgi:Uri superfamily endonuclease
MDSVKQMCYTWRGWPVGQRRAREALNAPPRGPRRHLKDLSRARPHQEGISLPARRPKPKGTYLLLAQLEAPAQFPVGKLGIYAFAHGWYAYVGSALGAGGLEARLARHARSSKRLHWHIDYLLQHASLDRIWTAAYAGRLECSWATALRGLTGAQIPVPGFGASDCDCISHLTFHPQLPTDTQISSVLTDCSPTEAVIHMRRSPLP